MDLVQRHLYLAHLLLMLVVAAVLETLQMEQAVLVAAVLRLVVLVQQTEAAVAGVLHRQVLAAMAAPVS